MDDRDRIREAIEQGDKSRERLAEALGVSVASVGRLLRKDRALKAPERDRAFQFLGVTSSAPVMRQVPLVGSIAAGAWREAVQNSNGWTWCTEGGQNTFALTVDGDSMDLIAPPGAIIAVDPDDRDLISGKSYAVLNEADEATFKRFRSEPARLEPVSRNPDHQTIIVGRSRFQIIGRVVQAMAEL